MSTSVFSVYYVGSQKVFDATRFNFEVRATQNRSVVSVEISGRFDEKSGFLSEDRVPAAQHWLESRLRKGYSRERDGFLLSIPDAVMDYYSPDTGFPEHL